MSDVQSRRRFLGSAADLPLTVGSAARASVATASPTARCTILDARGNRAAADELQLFHVCDLLSRPIPIEPQVTAGSVGDGVTITRPTSLRIEPPELDGQAPGLVRTFSVPIPADVCRGKTAITVRFEARDEWDATSANLFECLLVPGS